MNKEFRFSRFSAFAKCPKRHYYEYEEMIKPKDNVHLSLGLIFHKLIEQHYKGEDISPTLREYKALVSTGQVDTPGNLMEDLFIMYTGFYADADSKENILALEFNNVSDLEDGDTISATIDRIVELEDGTYRVRDTKTTTKALKYTYSDVRYNQQLLWYVMVAEECFGITIDSIEIDEVRLALPKPVPFNANGKPSADKKRLDLVLLEDYQYALQEQGLLEAPEYQNAIKYLEERGNPFFRRTTVQILDRNVIASNAQDLIDVYHTIKQGAKYRVRGPLCNYCGHKDLCELDCFNPSDSERQIFIEKIVNNS